MSTRRRSSAASLAWVLTIAVHPLIAAPRRSGLPSWLATSAMPLAAFAIVLGIAVSPAVLRAQLATLLPSYQPGSRRLANGLLVGLAGARSKSRVPVDPAAVHVPGRRSSRLGSARSARTGPRS